MVEDYERVMRNRLITFQVISFESHVFTCSLHVNISLEHGRITLRHEMIGQAKCQVLGLSSKDILQEVGQ